MQATPSASSSAGKPATASSKALAATVALEQDVYTYTFAQNGSTPMWCYGNTCIVRTDQGVFASGVRTLPDYKPLNNVRWMLLQGRKDGWKQITDGVATHEREPCPLICLDGRLFLSTNPNSSKPEENDGKAQPRVLQFDFPASLPASSPASQPAKTLIPKWNKDIAFRAHTYRSFVADAANREFLLFWSIAYDKTYWSFYDKNGDWAAQGELDFPTVSDYDKPQQVRVCYPAVQLKDRAVYYCGVSDIMEPKKEWKGLHTWVFRRLFYTWSDDITTGKFHDWVELANVDKTAGRITPCDLWAGPDGRVHILWMQRDIDETLRKDFFPEAIQRGSLNYVVLRDGKVLTQKIIQQWEERKGGLDPTRGARFHLMPEGRLLVVYYAGGRNWLVEINQDDSLGQPILLPLKKPLAAFFVAGPRGGSAPSMFIDMLGVKDESDRTLRYACIRLH